MLKVLSLFDGLAGARIALDQLNIQCEYYSSEIDKYAIQVAFNNYPDMKQLGDVRNITKNDVPKIDLLIGGSPCQDLTSCGNRDGLCGTRSSLFYEFVRLKNELNPKYFLLENVASMSNADRDVITFHMDDVQPVLINSAAFTAQNRRRLYWTNILIKEFTECNDVLADILEHDVPYKYLSVKHLEAFRKSYNWTPTDINGKSKVLMASYYKQPPHAPYIAYEHCDSGYRLLTAVECERLQGIPDNYSSCVSWTQRIKMIGNGFTIPVIKHILSGIDI